MAGVTPDQIGYIEGHGTGTPLGDPIEVAALASVFRGRPAAAIGLGSVKSNIGHTETAAGIAGLIKTVLMLEAGRLAPTLHAARANPRLDIDRTPFRLVRTVEPWLGSRRAGVSSFGIGGTNAHIVLGGPRCRPGTAPATPAGCGQRHPHLVPPAARAGSAVGRRHADRPRHGAARGRSRGGGPALARRPSGERPGPAAGRRLCGEPGRAGDHGGRGPQPDRTGRDPGRRGAAVPPRAGAGSGGALVRAPGRPLAAGGRGSHRHGASRSAIRASGASSGNARCDGMGRIGWPSTAWRSALPSARWPKWRSARVLRG